MIYNQMIAAKVAGKKQFAVLIDPDKFTAKAAKNLLAVAKKCPPDYFFVGGNKVFCTILARPLWGTYLPLSFPLLTPMMGLGAMAVWLIDKHRD